MVSISRIDTSTGVRVNSLEENKDSVVDFGDTAADAINLDIGVAQTGTWALAESDETIEDPFLFEIQGEALTIEENEENPDTVVRDAGNPESNPGTGADGLWDGYTGNGYLDLGADIGDAALFNVSVEEAGAYTLSVRYANGAKAQVDRPMDILVGGASQGTMVFPGTGAGDAGWLNWTDATIDLELAAGSNTLRLQNLSDNGPNIDRLSVSRNITSPPEEPISEPGERFTVKVNFQPDDVATPNGYVADTGLAFGEQSIEVDGQIHQYGWVSETSIADGTDNGTTPLAINDQSSVAVNNRTDDIAGLDPRQGTYAHFALPSYAEKAGWEIELENGFYEVTASIGDASGPFDSNYVLNAEDELFNDPFTPFRPDDFPADDNPSDDTEGFRSDLVTRVVQVTDGRLTLDSIGMDSANTEIQYLEIQVLPDLTPEDDRDAPEDYAFFTDPRAIAGVGANEISVDLDPLDGSAPVGVDPNSDIFLGISVVDGRGGALLESLEDGSVRLFETLSGEEVTFNVNTTGGFDSLTVSPIGGLKKFTSYTLTIDGFKDRGDNDNPDAPTREFQKFTNTFVTGEALAVVAREVAFKDVIELNGAADGAFGFTSLEISPDGTKMYIATITGDIKRYDVDPITGGLSNEQVLSLDYFDQPGVEQNRGIIGLAFDPRDSNVLWVSDNYPIPLTGRDNGVPDFSGRVSKITLGEGNDFTGTAETYITGLPRSNGDHVTNSLEFRANPDYDAAINPEVPSHLLYLIQGSNTAMGEPDSAWGERPERLLNASVMEIDPTRNAPEGGFDVSTEPLPSDGFNRRFDDPDGYPKNGPIPMDNGQFLVFAENGTATVQDGAGNILERFYDPFADDAVVKLFATGTRNAYDLVWHSNGSLYVPTNGSAAGGNTPDDPATPENEFFEGVEKQDDYLFKVQEGGYYGHPNKLRGEYILNGGNPTPDNDINQVDRYSAGIEPDANYRIEEAYSLGENRSPNGATEYTSGVFGGNLQGNLLFAEYSGGDDIRSITLDADGNVIGDDVLRDMEGNVISYIDPLDIIENPATGQLYLLTLNRNNGQSQILRLDPTPGRVIDGPDDDDNGELVPVLTIQAEGNIPDDGTSVTIANGEDAQIEIRTLANPESSLSLQPTGLRPGSFGVDGNTDDTDSIAGGYADFGFTNADFLTFDFELSGDQAGDSVLQVRYANGSDASRPLEVFVNGASIGTFAFTPPSETTEDDAWNIWQTLNIPAELVSGLNTVRFQAVAATGPNIDQLQILQQPQDSTPDDSNAEIAIQSNDAAHFPDRLQFNYLENNNASNPDRDFKEGGSVVISNIGTAKLSIIEAELTGPFALTEPDIFNDLTLEAGESVTVEILFDRDVYTPPTNNADDGVFGGALRLVTNDADTPVAEVQLAGFWQARDEGGWEPNINEVWEVFGFGNAIEGLSTQGGGQRSVLDDFDLYRPVNDDEVLSRYWKIADGVESAKITQIAAFHGDGGATLGIHNPGNKNADIILSKHAGDNNQSLLPTESDGQFATATITPEQIPEGWLGNDIFGIEVANLSTDPSLNPSGGGTVPADAEGIERGYTVRMFQALEADGNVIPNTYLGVMDYTGINYDYNDNMFVVEGVEAVFDGGLSVSDDDISMSDSVSLVGVEMNEAAGDML
nr:carbohydrate-binding protein [uncultured Halomonas sp.]